MASYQSMDYDDIGLDPDFDIFSYYKYCSETVHFDRDDVVNFYIFNR
jgi:hypothetical protein